MTICSSQRYLTTKARQTLLGKMALEWGEEAWVSWDDLLSGTW